MQRRELILLMVVGALLLGLGALYGAGKVRQALAGRRAELARLKSNEIGKQSLQIELRDLEARKERLLDRSLPADANAAAEAYQKWLEELFDRQIGKAVITRDPTASRSLRDRDQDAQRLSYSAKCNGSYLQLVNFLEKFYATDHLHKITSLQFPSGQNPGNTDPRALPISMQIEALSLRQSANKKELSQRPSVENEPEELRESVAKLLRRDMFRENIAPKLGVSGTVRVTEGRSISIALRGSDDDGDRFTYQLKSGPEWLGLMGEMLVSKPGSSPAQKDYPVTVSVTDNGLPPLTKEQTFTISVQPLAVVRPPKKFDHTRFAKVEAFVERGDVPEVWITVQTLDKHHKLHVGEEFEIDGQKLKILGIDMDRKTVEVELPGKRRRTVGSNQSLGE